MSLKITIFDGAIPMLDEIAQVHYGQGLDALDHSATTLRDATRRAFRLSTTRVRQFYNRDGKWQAVGGNKQFRLGRRISHVKKGGLDPLPNMENLITSALMTGSMTAVVAGKHKRFTPLKRRNGKVVGTLKTVGAVTKGSYAILKKLNYGRAGVDSEYEKVSRTSAQEEFFKGMNWKAHHFIMRGRLAAMPKVQQIMTSQLEQLIQKQINRVNVTQKVVRTA